MEAEIETVNVPEMSSDRQVFVIAKKFGKIICKLCRVVVRKAEYGKHFTDHHGNLIVGNRNDNFGHINRACEAAIQKFKCSIIDSGNWCYEIHLPVPYLEVKTGILCTVCRDNNPKVYHVALDRKQLATHVRTTHPLVQPHSITTAKFQCLAGNNKDRIVVKDSRQTNTGAVPPSVGDVLSREDILALANNVEDTHVVAKEPQNFRELTLVEEVLQTKKCILPDHCEVVWWILGRQNPVFADKHMKQELREAICEFLQLIVKKAKSEPPPQFLQVIAEFCERDEFTFISTLASNYQRIYWLLIVWLVFVFFADSNEGDERNLFCDSWTDQQKSEFKALAGRIPPSWRIGIDHPQVKDAVWGLFSALRSNAGKTEQPEQPSDLQGDRGDDDEPSALEVAADIDNECAVKYFPLLCRLFLLLFARTAVTSSHGTHRYDALHTFVVAVYIGKDHKTITKTLMTSYIAGLEYALRSVVLLSASDQFATAIIDEHNFDLTNDMNSGYCEIYNEIAMYIKMWTHPNPTNHNVANLLSHFKIRIRKRSSDDVHATMQIHSMDGKLEFVFERTGAVIDFQKVKSVLSTTVATFNKGVNGELPPNLIPMRSLILEDQWNNKEVGYSIIVANNLENTWVDYFGEAKFSTLYHNKSARCVFFRKMDLLHDQIIVLVQCLSGGPTRSTSLAAMQFANSGDILRSLVWFRNNLLLMTRFEKPRNVRQKEVVSIKAIPKVIVESFLRYMLILRQAEAVLRGVEAKEDCESQSNNNVALSKQAFIKKRDECRKYIFLSCGKRIDWDGKQIRDLFPSFWSDHGLTMRFNDWRHLFETLLKHILDKGKNAPTTIKDLLDLQMGHSLQTGRALYGLTADDPGQNTLIFDSNIAAARVWQELMLGTGVREFMLGQQTMNVIAATDESATDTNSSNTLAISHAKPKAIAITSNPVHYTCNYFSLQQKEAIVFDPLDFANVPRLERIVEAIRKQPIYSSAMFTNDGIQVAFQKMLSSAKDFVLVVATGMGKSTIFHYMARDPSRKNDVAIVFVATKMALLDQVRSAVDKNLPVFHFQKDMKEEQFHELRSYVKIIFAQIEDVSNPSFVALIKDLVVHERLGTMILDECHLAIAHMAIRGEVFDKFLVFLRQYPATQKFFLTATLPWYRIGEVQRLFGAPCSAKGIKLPGVIYEPSIPKGVAFRVRKYPSQTAAKQGVSSMMCLWSDCQKEKRMMIFVASKQETVDLQNEWSGMWQSPQISIDHGSLTVEQKKYALDQWRSGATPIMIATTGMGQAIDCHGVNLVVVLGDSFDVMTLLQMAGRNRGVGDFVFVTWTNKLEAMKKKINSSYCRIADSSARDRQAIFDFLTCTNGCLRSQLSKSVYNKVELCLPGIHRSCDWCMKREADMSTDLVDQYIDPKSILDTNTVGTIDKATAGMVSGTTVTTGSHYGRKSIALVNTAVTGASERKRTSEMINPYAMKRPKSSQAHGRKSPDEMINPYTRKKPLSSKPHIISQTQTQEVIVSNKRTHTGSVGNVLVDERLQEDVEILHSFRLCKAVCPKCLIYKKHRVVHAKGNFCETKPKFVCFRCKVARIDTRKKEGERLTRCPCGIESVSILLTKAGANGVVCSKCLMAKSCHDGMRDHAGSLQHRFFCPFFETEVVYDWCMFAYHNAPLLDTLLHRLHLSNVPRDSAKAFADWIVRRDMGFSKTNGLVLFLSSLKR